MMPATAPREDLSAEQLLWMDRGTGRLRHSRFGDLPDALRAGDLLVVNDSATFPASLSGSTAQGEPIEVRLCGLSLDGLWRAIVFGAGDWRWRTEDRPPPPRLEVGARLHLEPLEARVVSLTPHSNRLVVLDFELEAAAFWRGLYLAGRPIQYSYLRAPLALWDVQSRFAGRPWSVEAPSAGRPLSWALLGALAARGVLVVPLTHGAGISSLGAADLDRLLPFAEPYDIPEPTAAAIEAAREEGRRVVALGTTVVRALEGCASSHQGKVVPGRGITELRIDRAHRLAVVEGILTGMHERGTSHFQLLEALVTSAWLDRACDAAEARGYLCHEFGDSMLVL